MKAYNSPEIELIRLGKDDILTASSGLPIIGLWDDETDEAML